MAMTLTSNTSVYSLFELLCSFFLQGEEGGHHPGLGLPSSTTRGPNWKKNICNHCNQIHFDFGDKRPASQWTSSLLPPEMFNGFHKRKLQILLNQSSTLSAGSQLKKTKVCPHHGRWLMKRFGSFVQRAMAFNKENNRTDRHHLLKWPRLEQRRIDQARFYVAPFSLLLLSPESRR